MFIYNKSYPYGRAHKKTGSALELAKAQRDFLFTTLDELTWQYSNDRELVIINGDAHGADNCAIEWAMMNQVKHREYPANWKKYKKAAGPIRNEQMITQEYPKLVIAFPGDKGTDDMMKKARRYNIELLEIKYDH